ncbi:hypothetical protein SAMN05920897_10886 [Alkalispirochaeta americana]|uniref:Uncharacterized protein n=1 Tax=Alkalispirochaeta americana TaxID=159291 RepID=A0A1N6SHK3_9SPIO|nr:hypothetical protein [Alkalispirochaeta americana]SIQ40530.1 hypothetical protein SAMN05920897_10886 [Alkalispirochaeta americana]
MEQSMDLSLEQLEAIGRYVRSNLPVWMGEVYTQRDVQLNERMVRLEEELKGQRELMQQGFALMDKRFEDMYRFSNRWFMVISLMLALATLGGGYLGYLGLG